MPSLYVVATPIGNLEDISGRALRVLREVSLIAAEDTRKTVKLLNAYDIKTPLTSYYEHNKLSKLDYVLGCAEKADVALVAEAGTPGLSDPGYELVAAASRRGVRVIPIPGPSAIIAALVVSGLPTDRFTYLGFLPPRAAARQRCLQAAEDNASTLVFLESPRRLAAALADILAVLGDRRIAVCRELTKLHEEVYRGTVSEAIRHFTAPRGEFTLIVEGCPSPKKAVMTNNAEEQLRRLYLAGVHARDAVAQVARDAGLSRKELYRVWLRLDKVWEREKNACPSAGRS